MWKLYHVHKLKWNGHTWWRTLLCFIIFWIICCLLIHISHFSFAIFHFQLLFCTKLYTSQAQRVVYWWYNVIWDIWFAAEYRTSWLQTHQINFASARQNLVYSKSQIFPARHQKEFKFFDDVDYALNYEIFIIKSEFIW